MKSTTSLAAIAAVFMFAQSAQAHEHHHRHYAYRHYAHRHYVTERGYETDSGYEAQAPYAMTEGMTEQRVARAGLGGRPAAWCGWEMRQLVGNDPGPSYNLARNWAHWGTSGPAGIGAIVVWSHHVGKIVGQEDGQWVIESGNDGHALRTRPRSIAGAIAIRWG
jgi:hypothetical protein